MNKNEAKSFILYHNFFSVMALLTLEQRGELITAIFDYERLGRLTGELSPLVGVAFASIKDTLDRDREAYIAKCEKNSENGKKGGRPRKNPSDEKTERFFSKPKKAYNDNDNDNDNDNGNGNDNENENDNDNGNGNYNTDSGNYAAALDTQDEGNQQISENDGWVPPLPHGSAAPQEAPRISNEDKERLFSLGVTPEYLSVREERALAYAARKGTGVFDTLLDWWRVDTKKGRSHAGVSPPQSAKAAYAEEWLTALLEKY